MKKFLWAAGLPAALFFGCAVGGTPLDLGGLLTGRLDADAVLFLSLRLPRVVLAALVGGLLATAGSALQGALRNPLADPYLLGVSGGAALGAVTAAALGLSSPVPWAMAGAAAALALVLGVARKDGRPDAARLVLAGAAFHSVASSAMTLLLLRMTGRPESSGLYFWLLGGLAALPWPTLALLMLLSLAVGGALLLLAPSLNLLALGRDGARALGLDADRALWGTLLAAAAATGLAVAFNGMVPFVGLLVPHGARALAGGDHRRSLPASAALGAAVCVVADGLGRWIIAPREIPTGVVAALAGAPLVLLLLRRKEVS